MAERLQTLIRQIPFTSLEYESTTFSDSTKVTIDLARHYATLRKVAGKYSKATGLKITSKAFAPGALRQWLGFELVVDHGFIDGVQKTDVVFRLHDGTNEFWWDGSIWTSSGGPVWNTEQELADHISTFPVTSGTIRIVLSPSTLDDSVSPKIHFVKLAYSARIPSYYDDVFLGSLVPKLKAIRPTMEFLSPANEADTFDFGEYLATKVDTIDPEKVTITGMEAVFCPEDDPLSKANLLESYNPSTKIVTLNEVIGLDKSLVFSAEYAPPVYYRRRHVDDGAAPCPSIVVLGVEPDGGAQCPPLSSQFVANKAAHTAIVGHAPYRVDFECGIILKAPTIDDLTRLEEELLRLLDTSPLLTSAATGEDYRIQVLREMEDRSEDASESGIVTSGLTIKIHGVLVFNFPATTEPIVSNFNQTLTRT